MANTSKNSSSAKCFSGNILCGLLCTGSLPTHPPDQNSRIQDFMSRGTKYEVNRCDRTHCSLHDQSGEQNSKEIDISTNVSSRIQDYPSAGPKYEDNRFDCTRYTLRRYAPDHADQSVEPNSNQFDISKNLLRTESNPKATTNSPGIVARLMGLDSLPENPTFGSFLRSRSVNTIDFLPQFDLTQKFHHKRVKTSVSFRETSTFDQEKPEFFLFCFDEEEEEKDGYNIRRSKVGNQDQMKLKKLAERQRNNSTTIQKSCNCKKMDKTKKVEVTNNTIPFSKGKQKETILKSEDNPRKVAVDQSKVGKKKKKTTTTTMKKSKHESYETQSLVRKDLSPMHSQQAASPAEKKGKVKLKSRKCPTRVTNLEKAVITAKLEKPNEIFINNYIKMLGEICELAEEDVTESYWVCSSEGSFKFEDLEDLCIYYGQQVLEMLLDQVVNELMLLHWMKIKHGL